MPSQRQVWIATVVCADVYLTRPAFARLQFVTAEYGKAMNKQVEERLSFYESGTVPRKNIDVMHEAAIKVQSAKAEADAKALADKPAKRKKSKQDDDEVSVHSCSGVHLLWHAFLLWRSLALAFCG